MILQQMGSMQGSVTNYTYRAKKFGKVVYEPKHWFHTYICNITLVHKMVVEKRLYGQIYFSALPSYKIPEI